MALQTVLWDSRFKTFAVLFPAMGVMMWIASSLASEEFIIPAAVMGMFSVLVVFTVFIKTIRFESIVLCLLLTGYLIGNRGFADLTVVKPFFPGEVGLMLIVTGLLLRFALTRELPNLSGWVARVIFVYLALGAVRLLVDYPTYHLDAIRDSAMVYYSVYYFFGRQLAAQPRAKVFMDQCMALSFLVLVPIAIIWRLDPSLLTPGIGIGFLFQKDDLLTTFAAVAIFVIYTRPTIYRWKWVRASLILFYMVYVVSGIGRASLGALVVTTLLILIAGRPRFLLYPAFALILGLTVLTGLAATFGGSKTADPAIFMEKVVSMLDVTGSGNYRSDYGNLKASTNDFRRKLWSTFIDKTNERSPMFGSGFGYDFVSSFEAMYGLGEFEGLRSAHNFYVTLYGRLGLSGIGIFTVLTVQILVGGLRSAVAVRSGREPLANLSYWCAVWVILVSSIVGVVLEGPVGAIVFWTILGIAVESSKTAALEHAFFQQQPLDLAPLPVMPPMRRPTVYGMARGTTAPR